jgi:hypothetical protein
MLYVISRCFWHMYKDCIERVNQHLRMIANGIASVSSDSGPSGNRSIAERETSVYGACQRSSKSRHLYFFVWFSAF